MYNHRMKLHQCADDCQICATTDVNDTAVTVYRFFHCITDVDDRMSSNRLRLNASKTQVMWLEWRSQLEKITIHHVLVLSSVRVADIACDLGVVIDSQLTMAAHVSSLRRVSYFQLRQLSPVARSLSAEAAKSLVVM